METGNVVLDGYGTVIVIKGIRTIAPAPNAIVTWEPYDIVEYRKYKGGYDGSFNVTGYHTKETCDCWYNSAFRCYTASDPDEDCEKCKGSGVMLVYRSDLNDCKFLANNVTEYRIMKIEEKLRKIKKLENLKIIPPRN